MQDENCAPSLAFPTSIAIWNPVPAGASPDAFPAGRGRLCVVAVVGAGLVDGAPLATPGEGPPPPQPAARRAGAAAVTTRVRMIDRRSRIRFCSFSSAGETVDLGIAPRRLHPGDRSCYLPVTGRTASFEPQIAEEL